MVGLRAWDCRIQGLRTRNLQQGLGSSVDCLAVAPPLAVVSPFAGEPPLGNQATPEDPPTSALPHSPPEWSLGGMTGRNCSRASPSQPQEPTSSSTLLISFCPPGKGAKKPGTWDPGQCLSTRCETFWGGIVRRQIRFRRTGLPVSVHR